MRHSMPLAASAAGMIILSAVPAIAGYGAFAFDESTKKFGYSSNEPTQSRANQLAIKGCDSPKCKIVFPVGPRQCGALATAQKGTGWGGAVKATHDAAELAAVEDCQKHTSGQCTIRHSECDE